MENQPCTLCGRHPATKLNSHIIPSFMIARVCSYDGSCKRDKEVMFTMSTYEDKVYTGQIPSTKIEELFDTDKLTDERIEKELKDNTATKDNIFCPKCEKDLSIYLEAPYAGYMHNDKIDSYIAYFFWMSVVWRMSISEQFNFRLPYDLEKHLQESLHAFICAKITNEEKEIYELVKTCLFRYRLIISSEYLEDTDAAGFFGGRFDYVNNILYLSLGDKILFVTFNEDDLPIDYSFTGFEEELRNSVVNNGLVEEVCTPMSKEKFEKGIQQMIRETAFKRLQNEKELADAVWQKVGLPGMGMPDAIFKTFMERLYSEDSKQGDRRTNDRYVELFNETLQSFGFILR